MEVHTPRRKITSIKEFLRELVTIVAGVIIALSFEGVTAWKHHRDLAHEARANITSEVRENQRELEHQQQELKRMSGEIQGLIDVVHKLENNPRTP